MTFVACPRLCSTDRHQLRRIGVRDVVAIDRRGIVLHRGFAYRVGYCFPGAVLRQINKAPAPVAIGIRADCLLRGLYSVGVQYDRDARGAGALVAFVHPCLCSADRQRLRRIGVRDVIAIDRRGIVLHRGFAYRVGYCFPGAVLRQIRKAPAPFTIGIRADCLLLGLYSVGVQYDFDARGAGALVAFVHPCLCSADRQRLRRIGVRDVIAVDLCGIVLHFKLIYRVDYLLPGAVLRQIRKAPAPIVFSADCLLCKLLPSGEQYDCDLLGTSALVPRVHPRLCSADCQRLGRVGVRDIEAGGRVRRDLCGVAVRHRSLRHGVHVLLSVVIFAQLSEHAVPVVGGIEREGASGVISVAEELHGYRLGAQAVPIISVTPLLGDVHIDKPVIKAVVRTQQHMICVVGDILFVLPHRLIVIFPGVSFTVLCIVICDMIVSIAVAVGIGVIGRAADHALAERVSCHCAVSEEREVIPSMAPVVARAERHAVSFHSVSVAPQLYLHRNALILRGVLRPVGLHGDCGEELGNILYGQTCRA